MDDCPKYWQNFIQAINPDGDTEQVLIDITLQNEYNATRSYLDWADDCKRVIQFATANDLTLFVLSWS
jgi:hypothetical protein